MHGRWVSIVVVFAFACGDDAPASDAGIDSPIDANEGMGERVYVKVLGVRDPMSLTMHDNGTDTDQTLYITEDVPTNPGSRFPRRVLAGATFSVSVDSAQVCSPSTFNETNGPTGTTLELLCDGVTDLRAFTSTEAIRLTPAFDPRVTQYADAKTPWLLPAGQTVTITPEPMYADATASSSTVDLDLDATITVSYPGMDPRPYTFELQRELRQEGFLRSRVPAADQLFGGTIITNNFNISGTAVAISGDTMIVGAPAVSGLGAAYVFTRAKNAWTWRQTLTPASGSKFGFSVAIDGDLAVIGAPAETGGGTANAYVYQRTAGTWVLQAPLMLPTLSSGSMFGAAVAISGNTIVIGAPGWHTMMQLTPPPMSRPGTAYAYATPMSAPQTLITGTSNDQVGTAVAISGTTIGVGAPFANNTGAVYMFVGGPPWGTSMQPTPGPINSKFGSALDIEGTLLVVGAPAESKTTAPVINFHGAMYVFKYEGSSWSSKGRNTATVLAAQDRFGFAVAISGDLVIVGAPNNTFSVIGGAYIFRCDAGAVCGPPTAPVLRAPNPTSIEAGDLYGASVAIDRETFAIGAPIEAGPGNTLLSTGCALVFR